MNVEISAHDGAAETAHLEHSYKRFDDLQQALNVVLEQPAKVEVGLHRFGFIIVVASPLPALPGLSRIKGKPGKSYSFELNESLPGGQSSDPDEFTKAVEYMRDWCKQHPDSCLPATRRALNI